MRQRRIIQDTSVWYVIASDGDMVVRVRPGMPIGETAAGELSFDVSCAQLELNITDDGDLVLNAADDHELEPTGAARCRSKRLARDRRAEIRLAHNVLLVDTDFADPAAADDTVTIRALGPTAHVEGPEIGPFPEGLLGDLTDALAAAKPRRRVTPRTARSGGTSPGARLEPKLSAAPPRPEPRPPEADEPGSHDAVTPPRPVPEKLLRTEPNETRSPKPEELRSPEPAGDTHRPGAEEPRSPEPEVARSPEWEGLRPLAPEKLRRAPPKESDEPVDTDEADEPKRVDGPRTALPHRERNAARRQRVLGLWMAALIVLSGIGFALLYPALRGSRVSVPTVTVHSVPAPTTSHTPPRAADTSANAGQSPAPTRSLPEVEAPTRSQPVQRDELDRGDEVAEPQTIEPDHAAEVAEEPTQPPAETAPAAAVTIEPVVVPPIERRSVANSSPAVARATPPPTQSAGPGEASTASQTSVRPPDAALIAELEKVGVAARAQATELTLRRDLMAADLALAQDHLTTPPEASAYTLYNRVLALDPRSPEASQGLRAVRQGLINRALAQLAAGTLSDARGSLDAAAHAGASPDLVADLRGEVDYRQRLTDARAGRFQTLYPIDQLVAVSQEAPRLLDYAGPKVTVEAQFTVGMNGAVRDVLVLDAPPKELVRAVRRAMRDWRFEPALYNGRPIPVRSSVRFAFGR